MFKNKKILIVSGGTFGHIYPALLIGALYNADIYLNKNSEKFIKGNDSLNFIDKDKIKFFNYFKSFNPFILIKNIYFFWGIMKEYDTLITFGGYSCFPAVIASLFRSIKTYFHEQNAILGLVNRISYFLRFSPLLSFHNTKGIYLYGKKIFKKQLYYGYPILDNKKFQKNNEKSILVLSGSGGSDFFDKELPKILSEFKKEYNYKIYFLTKNIESVSKYFSAEDEISNFFFDIDSIFQKVDLVISRSGAGGIAKILYFNKPAILIPLENSAHDHQKINAEKSNLYYIYEKDISELKNILEINFNDLLIDVSKSDMILKRINLKLDK